MEKQNKTKILLVDDDEMIRIYFRDVFWIHGGDDKYEVEMATSLKEAEKKVYDEETRPDIIFQDVMLPIKGEDNSPDEQVNRTLAFIKKIKEDKSLEKLKVIIFSSQNEKIIRDEVAKLGVDGYLVKGELMPKEILEFTDKINESNN